MRIGAAGKIMGADDVRRFLDAGADIAIIGRAAILHHDFPARVQADARFRAVALPVSAQHLRREGLGPAFIHYMSTWKGLP